MLMYHTYITNHVMFMTFVCSHQHLYLQTAYKDVNIFNMYLWTDDIALDMLYQRSFVYITYIIF